MPGDVRPSALLKDLFAVPVIALETSGPFDLVPMPPEEEGDIRKAVPKRMQEFSQGRRCARVALAQLGIHDHPLRVGPGHRH